MGLAAGTKGAAKPADTSQVLPEGSGRASPPPLPRRRPQTGTLVMAADETITPPATPHRPSRGSPKARATKTLVMTPEEHASPPPVGVTSARAAPKRAAAAADDDDEGGEVREVLAAGDDDWDDSDDPPTQRRDPPRGRFTIPPDMLDDAEDGVPIDALDPDDETQRRAERVILVNGANTKERVEGEIVRVTDRHLFVMALGVMRRVSRAAGFEHPPGGGWSTWRLAGRDRRRWSAGSDD